MEMTTQEVFNKLIDSNKLQNNDKVIITEEVTQVYLYDSECQSFSKIDNDWNSVNFKKVKIIKPFDSDGFDDIEF